MFHKIDLTVSVIFCISSMHLLSTSIGFSPFLDKILVKNGPKFPLKAAGDIYGYIFQQDS